jgi:hypothetical protein
MDKPIETYWKIRLEKLKKALEANNFEVYLSDSAADAKSLVLDTILPAVKPASIAWGGSVTVVSSGLYASLKNNTEVEVLDTFDKKIPAEAMLERRRQALLVDLFITGTNAVTESGQLVNLDMAASPSAPATSSSWSDATNSYRIWKRLFSESKIMRRPSTPCVWTRKRRVSRPPSARSARAPTGFATRGPSRKNRTRRDG